MNFQTMIKDFVFKLRIHFPIHISVIFIDHTHIYNNIHWIFVFGKINMIIFCWLPILSPEEFLVLICVCNAQKSRYKKEQIQNSNKLLCFMLSDVLFFGFFSPYTYIMLCKRAWYIFMSHTPNWTAKTKNSPQKKSWKYICNVSVISHNIKAIIFQH